MGWAARWFRSLLGGKKEKEQKDHSNSGDRKEKKRWSFGKSGRDSSGQIAGSFEGSVSAANAPWLRSFYDESEEQNKHAIAVAAATAAAADAAVAAAQAAVAVVKLTSHGRGMMFAGNSWERHAAVKIQTAFRGHLVCEFGFRFELFWGIFVSEFSEALMGCLVVGGVTVSSD